MNQIAYSAIKKVLIDLLLCTDTVREKEFTMLKQAAADSISGDVWTPEMLDEERNKNNNCWNAHENLNAAVARVEDGLIERGEDSRLVVLAMISSEHILLLGKPGTGKLSFTLILGSNCMNPIESHLTHLSVFTF